MKKRQLKVINPVPDVNLLTISLITQGLQHKKWKKFLGFYFEESFSAYHKNFLNWYVDFYFWQKFGKVFFRKIYKNKNFTNLIYRNHKRIGKLILNQCNDVLKRKPKEFFNSELIKVLEVLFSRYREICSWGIVPAVIDFENNLLSGWLEAQVLKYIKKYKVNENPQKVFSVLTTSLELTFSQKENIDLLKLAQKKIITNEDLIKHQKKYGWVDYGYIGPIHPFSFYKKRLLNIRRNKLSPKTQLNKLLKGYRRIREEQKLYEKKLHLDAKTRYLFGAARRFMFLKLYRKEVMFKAIYVIDKLLKEISRKYNYSLDQLHYCLPEEIISILKGKKVSKKELNRRINSYFVHGFLKGKNYFYYAQRAKNIIKKNLYQEKIDKTLKEIKGQAAFLGKVKGKVKIVNQVKEIKKVKKGDILVSIATSPNILPAMKKATAFVTDTGGITCHAAIVAREMKKPCLIGTKIATKLLKDGDEVLVDANKGIVKKI